jgi:hypothetical protein
VYDHTAPLTCPEMSEKAEKKTPAPLQEPPDALAKEEKHSRKLAKKLSKLQGNASEPKSKKERSLSFSYKLINHFDAAKTQVKAGLRALNSTSTLLRNFATLQANFSQSVKILVSRDSSSIGLDGLAGCVLCVRKCVPSNPYHHVLTYIFTHIYVHIYIHTDA